MADGVMSTNIVGYVTTTATKATFSAIGVQFVPPADCSQPTVRIVDLVTITNPRAAANISVLSDQIHVWTGAAWKKYFNKTGVGYVWADAEDKTVPTTDTVSVGDGVFFRRGNAANGELTIAGGLYEGDTVTYNLPKAAFTFIANPWPMQMDVAELGALITTPKAAANISVLSDQIHVWTGSAWKKYFNKSNVGYVWADAEDKTAPTTDTIPAGACVFIRKGNAAAGTVTFTKPAGL